MSEDRNDDLAGGMNKYRYRSLIYEGAPAKLTDEEVEAGWHFCNSEWDGALIHKTWPEFEACTCADKDSSAVGVSDD